MAERSVMLEALFTEYGRTMQEAQSFEGALQFIAAMEIESEGDLSPLERTQWFFARSIGWLQKRLEFPAEVVREIDDLRLERNRLVHRYLARIEFTESDPGEVVPDPWENELPEPVRRDEELLLVAIREDYDLRVCAAVRELRDLRARFKACNDHLHVRCLARFPRASSWEEVEEDLRRAGWRQQDDMAAE